MSDVMDPKADDCADCPLIDRRGFLRTAAFLSAGAAVTLASPAHALPLITALHATTEEKTYALPAVDGVQIDKDMDVILSRSQGKVYAFNLACPHQNTAIKWDAGRSRFQCPKHKSIYTPDGVFVEGRATRGLDRFAIRKEGNSIVVTLDPMLQEDEDAEKWKKAFATI